MENVAFTSYREPAGGAADRDGSIPCRADDPVELVEETR